MALIEVDSTGELTEPELGPRESELNIKINACAALAQKRVVLEAVGSASDVGRWVRVVAVVVELV